MYPDWVEKHRGKGKEIKKIGKYYYLSEYKTVYNPETKKPKKISLGYIGRITEDGVIPAKRRLRSVDDTPKVSPPLEFGASHLLEILGKDIFDNLKEVFPNDADTIFSLAKQYMIDPSPLKRRALIYENSYDSILHPNLKISSSSLHDFLNILGKKREQQVNFMKKYLLGQDYVIFDGTRLVSYSENMSLAQKGYNHCNLEDPQINLLYCFSLSPLKAPVYFRANAGDKSDYDTILNAIRELGLENVIIIADKGFGSDYNFDFFKRNHLNYIVPLRRNSKEIDYAKIDTSNISKFDGYFDYRNRLIFFKILSEHKMVEKQVEAVKKRGRPKKNVPTEYEIIQEEKDMVVLYYDEQMKHQEFRDTSKRIINNNTNYTIEKLEEKQKSMGTLTIRSNKEVSPKELYKVYKEREIIEDSNKAYKHVLEIDASNLQNENTYNGWLFLNHISLMLYYRVFNKIKESDKTSKYSVADVIAMLKRVTKQKIDDKWITEIGTKVNIEKIREIFPDYNT